MMGLRLAIAGALLCFGAGAQACHLRVPDHPMELRAVVIGPSPVAETRRQTEIAIRFTGGAPNPRYAALPRILADFSDNRGVSHRTIAAVIDGIIPAAGSSVVLRTRYLDPADDCRFIPWTVKSLGSVS
jgi:hypothetical protein